MAEDRSLPPGDVPHRAVLSETLWKQKVRIRVIVKHIAAEAWCNHQRSLRLPRQHLNITPLHCSKMYMRDECAFMSLRLMNIQMVSSSHLWWPQGVCPCFTYHTLISHGTSFLLHRLTICISTTDSHHHSLCPCLKPFFWPVDGNLAVEHAGVCQATLKLLYKVTRRD